MTGRRQEGSESRKFIRLCESIYEVRLANDERFLATLNAQTGAVAQFQRDREVMPWKSGGLGGTRTHDQCLKRALLYQLSYQPICLSFSTLW